MNTCEKRPAFLKTMVWLLLPGLLSSNYAIGSNYLEPQEKKLGTDSTLNRSFHVVADEPQGFGLRMEGYIIGIEKTDREKIDVPALNKETEINRDPAGFSTENKKEYLDLLDDGKRTFISHVVRAKVDTSLSVPFVKNEFLYDAYCTSCNDARRPSHPVWSMESRTVYERAWESLEKLEDEIASQLTQACKTHSPYTHVIVGTMGWNTPQEKAIRNLNSIFGNLLNSEQMGMDSGFKPLYIAVTWPSMWNVPGVSLANKANDADEIGFLWVNALINRHLSSLRARASGDSWPAFKIVAIGHSLGARLVTRATFSGPALSPPVELKEGLDLVIGLQGAFSTNRFLKKRKWGQEGAPYADYKELRGRVVLTWSEHDSATPLPNKLWSAKYVGAKQGYKRANDKDYAKHFDFHSVTEQGEILRSQDSNPEDPDKAIIYIDASELIKYEVLGAGGKAHSDIYNAYMGKMLARLITKY